MFLFVSFFFFSFTSRSFAPHLLTFLADACTVLSSAQIFILLPDLFLTVHVWLPSLIIGSIFSFQSKTYGKRQALAATSFLTSQTLPSSACRPRPCHHRGPKGAAPWASLALWVHRAEHLACHSTSAHRPPGGCLLLRKMTNERMLVWF